MTPLTALLWMVMAWQQAQTASFVVIPGLSIEVGDCLKVGSAGVVYKIPCSDSGMTLTLPQTSGCMDWNGKAVPCDAPPFDVPSVEWDGPDKECVAGETTYGHSSVCVAWSSSLVHHKVCVIPGTHKPDPKRFPIDDATGVTHCLALGKP